MRLRRWNREIRRGCVPVSAELQDQTKQKSWTYKLSSYTSKEIPLLFKPMWFRFSITSKVQTRNFWFQLQCVKSLEVIIPVLNNRKILSHLKNKHIFSDCQRCKIRVNHHPKCGEKMNEYRKSAYLEWKVLEPQMGQNTYLVILMSCWRLNVDMLESEKILESTVSGGPLILRDYF